MQMDEVVLSAKSADQVRHHHSPSVPSMGSHVHHLPSGPPLELPRSMAARTSSSESADWAGPRPAPSRASASLTSSTIRARIVVAWAESDRSEVVSSSPTRASLGKASERRWARSACEA